MVLSLPIIHSRYKKDADDKRKLVIDVPEIPEAKFAIPLVWCQSNCTKQFYLQWTEMKAVKDHPKTSLKRHIVVNKIDAHKTPTESIFAFFFEF